MAEAYLSQVQQQRLQLVLAPQLRQSLEFLQVPLLELRTLIRQEIEQNPTLEERTNDDAQIEVEPGATAAETPAEDRNELEFKEEYEKLAHLDDEWRDYFQQAGAAQPYTADDEERRRFFLESLSKEESLQDHLLSQLGFAAIDEADRPLATMLIGSLNDDGYLNVTLGELAETTGVALPRLERALRTVQEMDPVGVGARDLRECLLLQLGRLGMADSPAAHVVREHLDDLGRRRFGEIARALGVAVEEVDRLARFIATLEPRPGRAFSADAPAYVVPELTIQKLQDDYAIVLHNDRLPRVRISKHYRLLMEDPATPKETRDYIRDKIRSASFMRRSIDQRQQTIQNIAREIVKEQRGFLDHGVSHLRPLTMADIARKLGIHETTVSRAIANKYVQTPRGTFEMKYFFTPGYRTSDGEAVSNKTVKDALAQLVAGEDPSSPLSDQAIMDLLAERGTKVARRTIAKYREELRILPSHLRKSAVPR
jgi:RNA polymerase sigma-54 factor